MSNPVPNALALTTIADGAEIIAADHRNNYAAAVDTSVAQALALSVILPVANAALDVTLRSATVELV